MFEELWMEFGGFRRDFGQAITAHDVDCLYNFGRGYVAVCPDPGRSSYGRKYVVFNGTLHSDATLRGDAYLDSDMGVTLDGDGDFIAVGGSTSTQYSHTGTFSISMWVTKTECNVPGSYQMLYGHQESQSRWSGNWVDPENANIHLLIGCGQQGTHSTLEGNVMRTLLVDDDGNRECSNGRLGLRLAVVADTAPAVVGQASRSTGACPTSSMTERSTSSG